MASATPHLSPTTPCKPEAFLLCGSDVQLSIHSPNHRLSFHLPLLTIPDLYCQSTFIRALDRCLSRFSIYFILFLNSYLAKIMSPLTSPKCLTWTIAPISVRYGFMYFERSLSIHPCSFKNAFKCSNECFDQNIVLMCRHCDHHSMKKVVGWSFWITWLDYIKIQYIRISPLKSPNMHVHRAFSALGNCPMAPPLATPLTYTIQLRFVFTQLC